jgi:hypothetical protein
MKQGKRQLFIVALLAIAYAQAGAQKTQLLHFFVEAGAWERFNTPVSLDLTGINKSDTLSFVLYEKVKGNLVRKAAQVEHGYSPRLWWILDGTTQAGGKREFLLFAEELEKDPVAISTSANADNLVLKRGSSELLHYRTSMLYPPAKVDTAYKRNGFIHPLFSPSGKVLTMVSPRDHYHHLGLWNPWTVVKIDDHVTDFWNLYSKQGTVRFAGVNKLTEGPVFGGFEVKQEHIDFQGKTKEDIAINEVWDMRAFNSEPLAGTNAYLLDMTSLLSVAGTTPVILEAYRYGGGIGIRTTPEWNRENSTVLTSEGKIRREADGTRARWVDLNGAFSSGGTAGITFFSHPSNREHPEPMRVWPEDSNGRGDLFFEFCPIRHKSWVLEPGNVYRLQYRLLVYDGKIDQANANRLWNDFAYPPVVRISGK